MTRKIFRCISVSISVLNELKREKRNCESWDDTMLKMLTVYRAAKSKDTISHMQEVSKKAKVNLRGE